MKAVITEIHPLDTGRMHKGSPGCLRFLYEGVENGAGRISDGEEFARVFAFEFDAGFPEEGDGVSDGESP